jgi:hypothetical protein
MTISKEGLFNKALMIIGGPNQDSYIDNAETDDSTQAVWLRIVYVSSLDFCAIDLQPGLFKEYRAIDETSDSPESLDWAYAFDKPSEFIHLVRLTNANERTAEYDYDDIGDYLFCDFDEPIAELIISPEDSDMVRWPPGFSQMVSARMAVQVGSIWKPKMMPLAIQAYQAARTEAFNNMPYHIEKTPIWNENT